MYKLCDYYQKYFSEKHTIISENIIDINLYRFMAQY